MSSPAAEAVCSKYPRPRAIIPGSTARGVHVRHDVDLPDSLPGFVRGIDAAAGFDAGVRAEEVDRAELLYRFVDELYKLARHTDVGSHGQSADLAPPRPPRLRQGRQRRSPSLPRRQIADRRAADTVAPTSHDDYLVFDLHVRGARLKEENTSRAESPRSEMTTRSKLFARGATRPVAMAVKDRSLRRALDAFEPAGRVAQLLSVSVDPIQKRQPEIVERSLLLELKMLPTLDGAAGAPATRIGRLS